MKFLTIPNTFLTNDSISCACLGVILKPESVLEEVFVQKIIPERVNFSQKYPLKYHKDIKNHLLAAVPGVHPLAPAIGPAAAPPVAIMFSAVPKTEKMCCYQL